MLDPRDGCVQQFYFIRPFVTISRGKSYRVAGAMHFEPPIYLHYCPSRESYGNIASTPVLEEGGGGNNNSRRIVPRY